MRKLVVNVVIAIIALGAAVAPSSPAHGALAWEVGAYPVLEGSQVHFWICAPPELSDAPFAVDYATSDGTATAGEDYVATSGTLTFLPTERSRCSELVVDTIDDDVLEGVPYKVVPREYFNLDLTAAGSGEEVFGEAAHTQTYIYDGLDDWPMILDMTRATVTEGSKTGMVIWTPNPKPYPVTVRWETQSLSAGADDFVPSHGEVTIPPGENQRWISIPTIDDGLDEPSEQFRIVLSDNRPAEASVIDPWARGPITLKDNDPMPDLSVEDVSVTVPGPGEATSVEFSVSLSQPSGYVVGVDFATKDGSLTGGEDYEAVSGALAFPPGVTSQTVTVALMGPAEDLAGGTFELTLDEPENAGLGRAAGTATVTVADDGPAAPIGSTPPADPPIAAPPATGSLETLAAASPTQPTPVATTAAHGSSIPEPMAAPRRTAVTGSTPPLVRPAGALDRTDAVEPADESRESERLLAEGKNTASNGDPLRRFGGAAGAALGLVVMGWTVALGRRRWPFARLWGPAG